MNNQKNHSKESNSKVDYGLTTGSLATAASLAAIKKIINHTTSTENIEYVKILTPFDELDVDIKKCELITENSAKAIAIKYPYNDPDVTVNLEIVSYVELIDSDEFIFENNNENNNDNIQNNKSRIIIIGGEGVGTITKPGLQISQGEAAINPAPRDMIRKNLENYIPDGKIVRVRISVPEGQKIAKKTMNPKLGIVGGISILGTTGIARPMSTKAYKDSLLCQLDIVMAMIDQGKYKKNELVFVPGNIGEKIALNTLTFGNDKKIEKDQIIQMGNFIGFMLEEAKKRGINKLTLFGHIGKLVKIAGGIFNTKHSVADGRREIIATHAGLCGADCQTIKSIFNSKTTEEMIYILKKQNMDKDVLNSISSSIAKICLERFDLEVNVVLVDMEGNQLNSL